MCVYIYTYVYMCIHIYTKNHTHTHILYIVYMYSSYMCSMHVCIHKYMHVYMCVHICVHIHIHVYTCVCVCKGKPKCHLLVLLQFFVSPLPHQQNVSCWGLFFIWRNKEKLLGVGSGEWGGWGTGIMLFLVRNCWTLSMVWVGLLINHASWNGQMCWKSL